MKDYVRKYPEGYFEKLHNTPDEELTPQEKRLKNLHPWKKGQSGNPKGYKKGQKHWSTIFKRLMADPDFLKTVISSTPAEWQNIVDDTPADIIAAGVIASVVRDISEATNRGKSLDKNTRDAIELLNKLGYGEKQVHELDQGFFEQAQINFNVVPDTHKQNTEES